MSTQRNMLFDDFRKNVFLISQCFPDQTCLCSFSLGSPEYFNAVQPHCFGMLTWTSLQSKCLHSRKRFKMRHRNTSKQQCVDLLQKNDGFKITLTVHQPENLTLVQTVQFRLIKTFWVFFFFFWSQIFFFCCCNFWTFWDFARFQH